MKTLILVITLALGVIAADDIVTYDTNSGEATTISKPNHPSQDLY